MLEKVIKQDQGMGFATTERSLKLNNLTFPLTRENDKNIPHDVIESIREVGLLKKISGS